MIKIVCDRCGRETYMKNPDLTGRAKIGFEEYDLCKYCILDIKRFINQGRTDRKTEPNSSEKPNNCEDEPQTYITEDRDTQILDAWQVHHRTSTTAIEDEPQTEHLEQFRVGLEYHTDTTHFGKTKGESVTTDTADTPQTEELKCRNKSYYESCEYEDNCNPTVCFKALDEFQDAVTDCSWK